MSYKQRRSSLGWLGDDHQRGPNQYIITFDMALIF